MICVHPKMHPSKIFEIENFRKISISKIFIFIHFQWKFWKFLRSKICENFRSQKISFSYKFQWKILIFFRSKISIFFDLKKFHFHWIFNENFENFRKKINLENFQFSTLSCSNFLSNQYFLIIFFMDRCKIPRRIRWNRLERPKMHAEKDKRKNTSRTPFENLHLLVHKTLVWRRQFRGRPHMSHDFKLVRASGDRVQKPVPWSNFSFYR